MKRILVTVAVCISACTAAFSEEGPFGLSWGVTADSMRQIGVNLKETPSDAYGAGYQAASLAKALADQDATYLSFGHNDKLWRIVVISKEFSNDPMGISVKSRYSELLQILTEKYGKPKSFHTLGDSIYSQPKYFLAGIHGGNSFWYSNFSTEATDIQIGIFATSSSESRWRIIYEYKPLRSVFEQSKRGREKGAL